LKRCAASKKQKPPSGGFLLPAAVDRKNHGKSTARFGGFYFAKKSRHAY